MRSILSKKLMLLVSLSCLILAAAVIWVIRVKDQAESQLERSRKILEKAEQISFEKEAGKRFEKDEINILQSIKNVRAIARGKESYFAATDGGLIEISLAGKFMRHYTVLDGLFDSDLTSLAYFNSRLYIGTQTQGLIVSDGEKFERYRWPDLKHKSITALKQDKGRLLIGTFAGGLIQFDGVKFREIKAGKEEKRLPGITSIIKGDSRLYIATFSDGLWVEDSGRWSHYTVADGLMSDRVVGVIEDGDYLYIATDFGLAYATIANLVSEFEQTGQRLFQSIYTLPSMSSLTIFRSNLIFSKESGNIYSLPTNIKLPKSSMVKEIGWEKPAKLSSCKLEILDGRLLLFGNEGIHQAKESELRSQNRQIDNLSFTQFGSVDDEQMPANNLISTLTIDSDGRLWAGSFRNGIDIFTPELKRLMHIDSGPVREINFLTLDDKSKNILAATSQGVIRFDRSLHFERITKVDGLLSNSVLHIATVPSSVAGIKDQVQQNSNALVLATSRGLSFGEPGKFHAMTRTQGLPSNSLYTALFHNRSIYAGTLGGLVEIEKGRIVRVFKDSNSNLTNNWITSICAAGQRIYLGTYGGGVFEMTFSGEIHGFAPEIGKMVVNPNAMFSDGERLYVGTLEGAWIFEFSSRRWIQLKDELPSLTVMSITGDLNHIYIGTTSGIARIEKTYFVADEE
jgi:ligand-binding sensor domain-containing protein